MDLLSVLTFLAFLFVAISFAHIFWKNLLYPDQPKIRRVRRSAKTKTP